MSSQPCNYFMVRGRLAGQPEVNTYGKTTVVELVLQYDEVIMTKNGEKVMQQEIPVQGSQYDVNVQLIQGIPVGSHVLVTGMLKGRRHESNGTVRYFPTIAAKQINVVGGSTETLPEDMPF